MLKFNDAHDLTSFHNLSIIAVLRIQLICMRIRILAPHWKKMDPGYFFKIYWIFLTKQNFKIFCLIFLLKLGEPFRNQNKFYNLAFFNSSDLGFESKIFCCCSFWLIFCPLDPDPRIRIFFRIRIQKAKILRIQRIRILSTDIFLPI